MPHAVKCNPTHNHSHWVPVILLRRSVFVVCVYLFHAAAVCCIISMICPFWRMRCGTWSMQICSMNQINFNAPKVKCKTKMLHVVILSLIAVPIEVRLLQSTNFPQISVRWINKFSVNKIWQRHFVLFDMVCVCVFLSAPFPFCSFIRSTKQKSTSATFIHRCLYDVLVRILILYSIPST